MSLLRFAGSGVVRNWRRTFSSILGVLLAISFLAGTFIAIDSSARATLDATLRGLPGDFGYAGSPLSAVSPLQDNGSELRAALAAVPGVTDVSVYRTIQSFSGAITLYRLTPSENYSSYVQQLWEVDPAHLPYNIRVATIAGSTSLPNGTVIVDSQTAANVRANLGDSVVLMFQRWNGTALRNYTVQVTIGAIATFPSTNFAYGPAIVPGTPYPFFGQLIGFNITASTWLLGQLNLTSEVPLGVQGEIWIDHDRFVNPYDPQASVFQLTRLGRQLDSAISQAGYIGQVYDYVTPALSNFSNSLFYQRFEYLLLSFPVILLGLYLGAVGVDLGHAERRRELGVLKTRGASRRQVAVLLILESLAGGVIATVLGLLFGVALSQLLVSVVTPFGEPSSHGTVTLTPETVITVAILSTLFMAVASYRSARRTASLPIIETLRYYAPGETRIHYSPVADVAMIGYSVIVYVFYWYFLATPGNIVVFMIAIPLLFSLPLAPILLIIGLIRLMTRSTGRVYEWTTRLFRPFARNLEHVVARNVARNPRRSSNIAIIIALGLAFGIFVVSSLASQQAMQAESIRANIGADLSASAPSPSGMNDSALAGFAANLTNVSGIARTTPVLPLWVDVSPTSSRGSPWVYAVDPSTYFSVAQPAPFYFQTPASAAGAQQVLATDGQVLITNQFATDAALQVGDPLLLSVTSYSNGSTASTSVTVHIGGMVRFLPGTFNGAFYGPATEPDEVYVSYTTVASLLTTYETGRPVSWDVKYLVSFEPGADWTAVKAGVVALGATNVQVYQEQLAQLNSNPYQGSFLGFIRMEIAFLVVILTAGLGLIVYAASLERTVEFAGITARGSSGWQTAALLVGEAFTIMIIGVVMGFLVGLLTGYLSVSITTPNFTGTETIIPNLFVFPLDGLLLLILAPAAMLATTVVVSWKVARMNVARVLKMRGG